MEPVKGSHNHAAEPAGHGNVEPKSGRKLLRSLERADVAFYRVRLQPDVRVETISSGAGRLTGYSREQLAADPQLIWRVIHPDDRQRLQSLLTSPSQAAAPSSFRLVHREGRVLSVEHLALVTLDDRGLPTHIEGILRDVTPVRAPQQAPQQFSESRPAADDVPAAVYLADGTELVSLSSSIETLTGFTSEEWRYQPTLWTERLHPDDRARVQFLATAGAAGQAWQAEYRWIAKNGRIVGIRQASAPIRDEQGELICLHGLLLGGTSPHEVPSGSIAAQRMEAIARLAGVVAHDFNNLLTVILAHAEMLLDSFREPGIAHDSAIEIKNAGEAGARIARQLLALSSRQSITLKTIDLNEAIRENADALHELAGGEVELRLDLGSDLPPIDFDPQQLQRVLRNLVIDARDAMITGGRITIATRTVYQGDRREVRLTVSDSRPRPPQDAAISPFEPVMASKRSPRGAGLNRAAMYGIVTQVGGRISADAAPGGGLIVTIGLPAKGTSFDSAG